MKGAVVTNRIRVTSSRAPPRPKAALTTRRRVRSNRGPNSVKTKEADEENIKAYLELNKNPATKAEYDAPV